MVCWASTVVMTDLRSEGHYIKMMGGVSLSVCLSACLSHASTRERKGLGSPKLAGWQTWEDGRQVIRELIYRS